MDDWIYQEKSHHCFTCRHVHGARVGDDTKVTPWSQPHPLSTLREQLWMQHWQSTELLFHPLAEPSHQRSHSSWWEKQTVLCTYIQT